MYSNDTLARTHTQTDPVTDWMSRSFQILFRYVVIKKHFNFIIGWHRNRLRWSPRPWRWCRAQDLHQCKFLNYFGMISFVAKLIDMWRHLQLVDKSFTVIVFLQNESHNGNLFWHKSKFKMDTKFFKNRLGSFKPKRMNFQQYFFSFPRMTKTKSYQK